MILKAGDAKYSHICSSSRNHVHVCNFDAWTNCYYFNEETFRFMNWPTVKHKSGSLIEFDEFLWAFGGMDNFGKNI